MRSLGERRSGAIAGLALAGLIVAVWTSAAVASVANVAGHGYGITPIESAGETGLVGAYRTLHGADHAQRVRPFDEPPAGGSQLENVEGGPVMHGATTHVIFWDPTDQFTAATKGIVNGFFGDVAHDSGLPTNVFAIAGQYTDSTGNAAYSSTFAGALVDEHAYPASGDCTVPHGGDQGPPYASCLFDGQLRSELSRVIAERGLPTGLGQLYFVLLPHDVATCLEERIGGEQACSNNFYCAYHSAISPGSGHEVIYADIPFSLLDSESAKGCQDDGNEEIQLPNGDRGTSDAETRFADVALKYVSHEYIEAVTDPLAGFETAWVDENGLEIGDKCNAVPLAAEEEGEEGFDKHAFTPTLGGNAAEGTLFNQRIAGGSFYLQSEWDNAAGACLMKPLSLGEGSFSPSAATAGSPVTFDGSAFDPYGALAPVWTFGDGGTGVGAVLSHTYAAPGRYTVTMTPIDALTGATGAAVSGTVTVAAPPAPQPVSVVATSPVTPPPAIANSPVAVAVVKIAINARTGVVTLATSVAGPGTLSFLATFANGTYGAFAASGACARGHVKLLGSCLPARIVYAKGSRSTTAAGRVNITLKPSAAGIRALKQALRRRRAVQVTVLLTFQSARGGRPSSRSQTLTIKPKR